MTDPDLKNIIPYIPFYMADGNTVTERWTEEFEGTWGQKATIYKLIYRNKKGKLSDPITYRVEWK